MEVRTINAPIEVVIGAMTGDPVASAQLHMFERKFEEPTEDARAHWADFLATVNAMVIGYRVAIVPDRLQGRVNSVARSLALLAFPLGPVVAGLLLASYSVRTTAAFVLGGFVILAVATTVNRSIRGAPSFDEVTAS